ncbi:MAG: transposase, partial [Desulfobacterales bacterium]|nr:transposase [Desulfobacterales bacterium]
RYIGRYTHRIAISNHRIISITNGQIRFSYKKTTKKKIKAKYGKRWFCRQINSLSVFYGISFRSVIIVSAITAF